MLERTTLYHNSLNELAQARNYQSQASRKEFEMRLMEINSQYSLQNENFYYTLQKQSMELEINSLKNHRNSRLFNAIEYALQLAEIELCNNIAYSMAVVAINSINSFLKTYQPEIIMLPQYLRDKLTRIYNNYYLSSVNPLITVEINKLKTSVL